MGRMQKLNYPQHCVMGKVAPIAFRVIRSLSLPQVLGWPFLFQSSRANRLATHGVYLRLSGTLSKRTPGNPVSISARMLRWSLLFGVASTAW